MPNYNNKSGANGGYRGQGGRRDQDNRNGQRQNSRQPRREDQVTLTAPYQFAELNKDVYFPGWASQVSQDIPFYDGIDGVIEVTLMNVSPLFTRNGTAQNEKDVLSAHVMEGDQRRYIIPATTIKGMLRSTMEIMSFAKMNFFDDRYFAYREIASEEYRKIMAVPREGQPYDKEKIGCGWLRKEGDTYYLKPCKGRFERITHKDIESLFHVHLDNFTSSYERNAAIAKKNNDEWYPVYNGNYQIVCTGKFQVKRRDGRMEGKQKEYLFPREYEIESPVKKEIIKKFLDAHEGYTPRFKEEKGKTECYLNLLKKGHSIAVFFLKNPDGSVKVIGLSRMLRYPYEKGVEDIVSKQQPAYNDRNRLDLCEAIWGYTGDKESLKGRVQIGHAFCHKTISDNQLIIGKGTLGEPKASFYPLYLKQDKNAKSYKKYSDATEISGRKLYKIHKGSSTTDLPQGNSMTDCEFNAIPSGQFFTFKIHVHNIRPIELGALLCALTLNQTKDTYHNIGLAKAYGYGKIQITSLILAKGFDKKPEDYMREFEIEMSKFTWKKYKKYWVETQPLHCIASILQEHEDGELRTLELKEFGIIKKPKSPVQVMPLNEGAFMNSFITDIDKKYIQSEAEKKEVDAQSKADIERQKLR